MIAQSQQMHALSQKEQVTKEIQRYKLEFASLKQDMEHLQSKFDDDLNRKK